jgi:hypothetical protein
MKIIFAALCLLALASTARSDDGTVSVLKTSTPTPAAAPATQTTQAAAQPVAVQTVAAQPVAVQTVACCEEARSVKLSPWHTRRLNRIADRQEARESRNCCDCCNSGCECRKKPKTLVVESKVKKCDCCCK